MDRPPWVDFLTDSDREHLRVSGPPPVFGVGGRPAVLSVDNNRGAVGDEPLPLLESIREWPGSTGLVGWDALEVVATLLDGARAREWPIVHATGLDVGESGISSWRSSRTVRGAEIGGAHERERRRFEIVDQAAPAEGEVLIRKAAPSVFFGTPLMSVLQAKSVDTIVVCGQSTSGCVRATVVDGRSYRFNVIVVADAVYDRHESAHAMNLFDMQQKYADVMALDEALAVLT